MTVLSEGDFAPWFVAASSSNPTYHFDTVAGYRVILCFFGSSNVARVSKVIQDFAALQSQLEACQLPFFGVTIDPEDQALEDLIESVSYFKLVWDFDQEVSLRYGVAQRGGKPCLNIYAPTTFVLDKNLRILKIFPIINPDHHVQEVWDFVSQFPTAAPQTMANRQAPVLFIPQVFDRSFCQELIQLYEADGGEESGFMRQVDGKTVAVLDPNFKKRRDFLISDAALLQTINDMILRRVKPEIEKAFQFSITRFERHVVACYEATNGGFFNCHRDNTTKGTAHRRFAMTINLNVGLYEGGCLQFPEYDDRWYRPETGEAIIFSCSLLHQVSPITQGRRFALLSFFYNDEDAKIREQNQKYLVLNQS